MFRTFQFPTCYILREPADNLENKRSIESEAHVIFRKVCFMYN